jgi:hypothetical protein
MEIGLFNEEGAFRVVLAVIAGCVAVCAATKLGGPALGLGAFGLMTAGSVSWTATRYRPALPNRVVPVRCGAEGERLIVVVANEVLDCDYLVEDIRRCCGEEHGRVFVVCPAVNSRLRHWVSDEDAARAAARERLDLMIAQLEQLGVDACGAVGDADPAQALRDTLRTFGGDEVLLSKGGTDQANWLARRLLEHAPELVAAEVTYRNEQLAAEPDPVPQPGFDEAITAAPPLGDSVAVAATETDTLPSGPATLS